MDTYSLTTSEIEIIMALRDPVKRKKLLRIKISTHAPHEERDYSAIWAKEDTESGT